jgi:hypothetical protein
MRALTSPYAARRTRSGAVSPGLAREYITQ